MATRSAQPSDSRKSVEHAKPPKPISAPWRIAPLDSLRPSQRNSRLHPADQTAALADIIRRFGWTRPILYDGGADEIVFGHGASAAARLIFEGGEPIYLAPGKDRGGAKLPMGHVPVIDVKGWSDEERRAYLIADNAIAERAEWDWEMLGSEIHELDLSGFDLDLLGLSDDAMTQAMEAFAPEPPKPPASPIPEEAKERAWRQWAGELAAQIEACAATGSARQGITPGYALYRFLDALHGGRPYPRHAQAAFHPDLYRIPGAAQSVLEGLASVVSGATDYRRLEFACGGEMDPRLLMTSPLPFGGGARIALDFPAALARSLIDEFASGGSVLDPCHGWGGRLVGFLLSSAKAYAGTDPAPSTHRGVCAIRDLFRPYVRDPKHIALANLPAEKWEPPKGEHDLILTSPPYFDVEKYDGGEQSRLKHGTYADWRDGFYRCLIERAFGWLRSGGTFALQIGSQQYPLLTDGKALAAAVGFEIAAIRSAGMENNFTETDAESGEVILILRKP